MMPPGIAPTACPVYFAAPTRVLPIPLPTDFTTFLKRDYFTDVISFDYTENGVVSGDIMISLDRVTENASTMGVSYLEELQRIMVHGLLHLIGYDDSTAESKAVMTGKEDLYLGKARV